MLTKDAVDGDRPADRGQPVFRNNHHGRAYFISGVDDCCCAGIDFGNQ